MENKENKLLETDAVVFSGYMEKALFIYSTTNWPAVH